jgi:hypothetical protein
MPRAPSKIHVQSRRGPAGPPLLFAHQEKMTPDGPGALYFTERGSGPSFLLVHGLMVSGEMFKPVIDRLRRHLCAMFTQGIPLAAFEVTDIKGEFARCPGRSRNQKPRRSGARKRRRSPGASWRRAEGNQNPEGGPENATVARSCQAKDGIKWVSAWKLTA